jgi:hypothetical protein
VSTAAVAAEILQPQQQDSALVDAALVVAGEEEAEMSVVREEDAAAVSKAALPLIKPLADAEEEEAQKQKTQVEDSASKATPQQFPLTLTAQQEVVAAPANKTAPQYQHPRLADDDEAQLQNAVQEEVVVAAPAKQLPPLAGDADYNDPPSFSSRIFSSRSSSATSAGRSMQKVESTNQNNPLEAVHEVLGSLAPQKQLLLDLVSERVTATIDVVGDSGTESKLIHGCQVTSRSDDNVYVVWVDPPPTNGHQPQLYVEAFSNYGRFYALVSSGAVSIVGAKKQQPQSAPAVSVAPVTSTLPTPSSALPLSTIISAAAGAASAKNATIDLTKENKDVVYSGSSSANKESGSSSSSDAALVPVPPTVVDLTIGSTSPSNSSGSRITMRNNCRSLMFNNTTDVISFCLGDEDQDSRGGASCCVQIPDEDEAETFRLWQAGKLNLWEIDSHFAKKRNGGGATGASMMGGGDIALTAQSIKTTLAPFMLKYMLSNDKVTIVVWNGAGDAREAREVLLMVNEKHMSDKLILHLVEFDNFHPDRFNGLIPMPGVTFSCADAMTFRVPGDGVADIAYTTMMNGPLGHLRLLLCAYRQRVRYMVGFEHNFAYLAPVMEKYVETRLGTAKTEGGTSFQMVAVEIYLEGGEVITLSYLQPHLFLLQS